MKFLEVSMTKPITTRVVTVKHPGLNKRKVSVIFVNNELDMPSFRFLCNEAVTGGRKGSVSGETTHVGRAYKIAELYEYLGNIGLTWDTCEEHHIERIRNAMLHWNEHDEYSPQDYIISDENGDMVVAYERIENDSVNQKLSVWLKFYQYQQRKQKPMLITLSIKNLTVSIPDANIQHLYGHKIGGNKMEVERWALMVKPSPPKLYFPALMKAEYEALKTQLVKIDPVYAAIAEFGVNTGLRRTALLRVKPSFFKSTFIEINQGGKVFQTGIRTMTYINKGGNTENVDVPLRAIQEIKHIYMNDRVDRQLLHKKGCKKGTFKHYDEDYMWYRSDGKIVEAHDLDAAFRKASHTMGRTQGIDNIKVHHLRHTYATWVVLDAAKQLDIDLLQLDAKLVPGLMFALKKQLAHVDEQTTAKYIATAILMISPKFTGPLLSSEMLNKGKGLQYLLENDAKLHFGRDYDPTKFDPMKWAEFRHFDMESANIIALKKQLGI